MTAASDTLTARVVSLPARQTDDSGAVAVRDVLAEVLPLAAFRKAVQLPASMSALDRRCAALNAVGAWRRLHPGASFAEDLAAAEAINRSFGL